MHINKTIILSIFCALFVIIGGLMIIDRNPVNYEKIADKISYQTARKLKKEKNLSLIGIGGGMMDNIHLMSLKFQYLQEVDVVTARELVMIATQEYLSAINSSEKIRPYLKNYPFTLENIEIAIFFFSPEAQYLDLGKIQCADCNHGVFHYYLRKETTNYKNPFLQETYEEAPCTHLKRCVIGHWSVSRLIFDDHLLGDHLSIFDVKVVTSCFDDGARFWPCGKAFNIFVDNHAVIPHVGV